MKNYPSELIVTQYLYATITFATLLKRERSLLLYRGRMILFIAARILKSDCFMMQYLNGASQYFLILIFKAYKISIK